MKVIRVYICVFILFILLAGCGYSEIKEQIQSNTDREVIATQTETITEGVSDNSIENDIKDGIVNYNSRYLIGENTIYEVKKDKSIEKRFEMDGEIYMDDVKVDINGNIYATIYEYEYHHYNLYVINTKGKVTKLYSTENILDKLVLKEDKVLFFDKNNETEEILLITYDPQNECYTRTNGENVIDEIDSDKDIYVKKKEEISDKYDIAYITEDQDNLYFIDKKPDGTEEHYYNICQLNKNTEEERNIVDIPIRTCGYRAYQVIDDDLYFQVFNGKEYRWMKHSLLEDGETIDLQAIDFVQKYAAYGSIKDIYYDFYDDQGEKYMAVSCEKFIFDDSLPYAKKMNAALEKSYQKTIEPILNECRKIEEDSIRDYGVAVFKERLQDTQVFHNHYVYMSFSYECYRTAWYLDYTFDLDTGEQLTLDNMYHGTEEHYKEVVAKHMADFAAELYNEGHVGFTKDMDYQYFYDKVTTDMYVVFEEDGLYVSFNNFNIIQCDENGIAVTVPYEELGIEL